ncbi:MAG: hypothetical protein ACYSWO_01775 [Planctomycetota bacterium]|jgi:hypothetical protein
MKPAKQIEELIGNVPLETLAQRDQEVLDDALRALAGKDESECFKGRTFASMFARRVMFRLIEVTAIVALTLAVSNWLVKPAPEIHDEAATINFYTKEHQDVVARTASLNQPPSQPERMHVGLHDILYYEFLDDRPDFAHPGIIVRGPLSQRKVTPSEVPAISNGHTLTLSKAVETMGFDLVSPLRLHPGYILDEIRSIEGRDAVHLLYTDGINTVSLFEQPLEAEHGLGAQDFREYAVYGNEGPVGGTILAWKDEALSYVLIGDTQISQLMDMAQSISVAK